MIESVILAVSGMKCGGCEAIVTQKLGTIDGIKSVSASSKDKRVSVEFDTDTTSVQAIKDAIQAAGYGAQ